MRISVLVKLLILLVAFALVVWASVIVREGSLEGMFVSLTGVDKTHQINLCTNRIHSFKFADGKRIEEGKIGSDLQWFAYDPEARLLNYLVIEKWLGEHCYMEAVQITEKMEHLGPFNEVLTLEFIDHKQAALLQNSAKTDVYSWEGRLYNSPQISAAIEELRDQAGWR